MFWHSPFKESAKKQAHGSSKAGGGRDEEEEQEMTATESTPLVASTPKHSSSMMTEQDDENYKGQDNDQEDDEEDEDEDNFDNGQVFFSSLKGDMVRRESIAADRLSMRLLAIADDDSDAEDEILKESLDLLGQGRAGRRSSGSLSAAAAGATYEDFADRSGRSQASSRIGHKHTARFRLCGMMGVALLGLGILVTAFFLGVEFIGPPSQPVGPYQLIERQEGEEFFQYYSFYEGADSVGSNGYINYVSKDRAEEIGIANVTMESDELDVFFAGNQQPQRRMKHRPLPTKEPFLYMSTAPTETGPRESIRLEGKRRFNRGLFIMDVRHMPAGCGVWPAFWLTDEANWPVNGEIDIVEGVNYQSEAKTALHTTKGCDMFDVPMGIMTGSWDTSVGIPDTKTGIPDMTFRYAQDCFVYNPHQWLNQGCVAIDQDGDSLGIPLNKKGGGIFVLEWDPMNRLMRTWVFSPHTKVPENLVDAIRTAHQPDDRDRIMPIPDEWPLPYGYFPIGEATNCPSSHFRNMRLVLNTAFCGSVAGNRYLMDCKNQSKVYPTCNEYIKSRPDELSEAYWKIRGVYVYERTWQRTWAR